MTATGEGLTDEGLRYITLVYERTGILDAVSVRAVLAFARRADDALGRIWAESDDGESTCPFCKINVETARAARLR